MFIDNNGLPIKCNLYNGNTAESLTLIPEMNKIKKTYNIERTVVVTDKGLNTTQNIAGIIKNGDGYIFSQIIRGEKRQKVPQTYIKRREIYKEIQRERRAYLQV